MLHNILEQLRTHEAAYERAPHAVSLLAVSKTQSAEKIRTIYNQGQRLFGENYLQEALDKMADLTDCDIEWHFIGPIQSNKTKKIAEHFAWVQSVENEKIARRLSEQRPLHLPPLNICIEVNIDNEPTKHGVLPQEVFPLLDLCHALPHLALRGLMTIPMLTESFAAQCAAFHQMSVLWQACKERLRHDPLFDTLSMGTSVDFKAAIKEGATMVRLGSALFGERL